MQARRPILTHPLKNNSLSYFAENEEARRYLDGIISADEAVRWLETYSLASQERARQKLRFIYRYCSYVISYNFGLELVRNYIEAHGGTADRPDLRRKVEFGAPLESTPANGEGSYQADTERLQQAVTRLLS